MSDAGSGVDVGLADGVERVPQTTRHCGLQLVWDDAELEAVTDHHAELWREEKRSWGLKANGEPLEWLPGFVESVQRLLDQGYTYKDIGAFFGVSREAVRLWAKKYGLERMGWGTNTRPRIWSWEEECFVPVTPAEYVRRAREAYLTRVREEWDEKRRAVTEAIQALASDLGRPPVMSEIQEATGLGHTTLAHWWGYVPHLRSAGRTYAQAWAAMYHDAGVEKPQKDWTIEDGAHWRER